MEVTRRLFISLSVALTLCLSSCTYNISMIHTEGQATDVFDSEQSPDVSASIPVEFELPMSQQ